NNAAAPVLKKAGEGGSQIDGYALELFGNSSIRLVIYVKGVGYVTSVAAPLVTNQWSHVVGVYDGTNLLFYLNGSLAGSPVFSAGQIGPSGNHLQIGHDPSNPSRYFNGLVDEAAVYGSALSAAQVQAIYAAGSSGKCTSTPTIVSQPQSQTVTLGDSA